MARKVYLRRIATEFIDVFHHPGGCCGRIVDTVGGSDGGVRFVAAQTVVDAYHTDSLLLKFAGNLATTSGKASAMKPYYGRKVLFVGGIVEIELAALFLISIGGIGTVADAFFGLVCLGTHGEGAEHKYES